MSPALLSVNSSSRAGESRGKFTGRERKRPIGGLKASGAAFQLVALLQLRLQPASTLQGLPRSYLMKTWWSSSLSLLLSILLPRVFFFFFHVSQALCWHGGASSGFLITGGSGELIERCANQDVSYVNCIPPPAGRGWRWGLGVCARCQSWSRSLTLFLSRSLSLQLTWRTFFPFEKDTSHTHTHSWLPAGRHTDRCAASVRAAPRRSFKAARSSSSRSQKALIWIGYETMLPSRWRQQRETFLNLNSMFIIFLNLEEIYVHYYIFKSVVHCNCYFS